jgi:ATP-dependent DNA ligase
MLERAGNDVLRFSEAFEDPIKLLNAAAAHGLEGIVSKLRDQAYCSGKNTG